MLKLSEEHRAELDDLCRLHHVSRLELFGSALRGSLMRRLATWFCWLNSSPWSRVTGPMPILACCTVWTTCSAARSTCSRFSPFATLGFGAPLIGSEENSIPSCFGLAVAESAKSTPLRLPPFLREAGGGGGLKGMNPLFVLLHFTIPPPAGVSPSRPFFPSLRRCEQVSKWKADRPKSH